MQNDPRYVGVGAVLPAELPPLQKEEARKLATKLIRKFGAKGMGPVTQKRAARVPSWSPRRVWVSKTPTRGADNFSGMGRLIHDISHYVFRVRNPGVRPHHNMHSRLELQMAEFVAEELKSKEQSL